MHAAIYGLHAGATGSNEEDECYVHTQQVQYVLGTMKCWYAPYKQYQPC